MCEFKRQSHGIANYAVLVGLLALAGCGGSDSSPSSAPSTLRYATPQTYTVGTAIAPLDPSVTGSVTSFSISPALPAGLSIDKVHGEISGTPTGVAAAATYTVTAQNGAGSTPFGVSITVNDKAPTALSYATPQTYVAGTAIAPLLPTISGNVVSFSISPTLPAGLSLNAANGEISGTPTAPSASVNYTLTAQNSGGSTPFVLSLGVNAVPLVFASPGPLQATYGDPPITNIATGGVGTGTIIYSSSNAAIATVDSGAVVTITGAGMATITAADSNSTQQSTYSLTIAKAPQTLTLTNAAPLDVIVGRPVSAPIASNIGPGALTFQSSSATVSIDNTGSVLANVIGSATISILKAGNANYLAAQASFMINAIASSHPLSAWVGASDSIVTTIQPTPTLKFYRSSLKTCDLTDYQACPDGQLDLLSSGAITDTTLTQSSTAYYWLQYGNLLSQPAELNITKFTPRAEPVMTPFNGRLFLVAGYDGQRRNDVWSSADGKSWIQATAAAGFSPRTGAGVTAFNGLLWVIGGYDGSNLNNDIWVSADGTTWTQKPLNPGFSPRSGARLVSFGNRLWLIGGDFQNDVWSTTDGITWTLGTSAAAFSARQGAAVQQLGSKLYLVGGFDSNNNYLADVWVSSDVVNWTLVTMAAPFTPRYQHQLGVVGGQLVVYGGIDNITGNPDDAWGSADGVTWQQLTAHAGWSKRIDHTGTVFNGQLWLAAGADPLNSASYNDVWSSSDGATWQQATLEAPFVGRYAHAAIAANGAAWVIAGFDGQVRNDAWSTVDGINWTISTAAAPFPARFYPASAAYNNRLWILTGFDAASSSLADVWSSADGQTWTEATANAAFGARNGSQAVSFAGQLWLLGGSGPNGNVNDVWASSDGALWTEVTTSAAFPIRGHFQALSYNNRLWVLAGLHNGPTNDVWSSLDGITWTQATAAAAFAPRADFGAAVFKNEMWVLGGYTSNSGGYLNDVWHSPDGVTWTQATAAAPFSARAQTQALVLNNQLCVVAGNDGSRKHDFWCSTDGTHWREAINVEVQF